MDKPLLENEKLLTCSSVEVSFSGRAVVKDISLALHEGEILGLVGESGSGKSTLIRAAMGLLRPGGRVTKGEILYQGKNIPELPERELRKLRGEEIGMIFQDAGASLSPIRTIGSQITESMRAHRRISREEAKDRSLELFLKLGFQEPEKIWRSYPFELSGGMKQRAGIAIAMLLKPRILLADEPTSALDAVIRKQTAEEMLRVRELFGTSIILVTHDIGAAAKMADTMAVLKEGRLMEYGPAEKVLSDPENEYTRQLIAAVPRLWRA
ncbi:MAG: ABC transporter ATP-binding protein [Lachnospiraceae bacterium]|nr:ABC transporter ATP-binding protein [Lachnospiraceae bacterium]